MTPPFAGKQLWVVNSLDNPAALVLAAADLGCSGVIVKAYDGSVYWQQIEGIKEAMLDLGQSNMMLGAFGYHYGDDIAGIDGSVTRCRCHRDSGDLRRVRRVPNSEGSAVTTRAAAVRLNVDLIC